MSTLKVPAQGKRRMGSNSNSFIMGSGSGSITPNRASFDHGEDLINNPKPLDVSKIQNSSNVSSSLNDIYKKSHQQKEAMEKELAEQQEKTKDFEAFQNKIAQLNKQSMQKEKEFEQSIQQQSEKIKKQQAKKVEIESKILNQSQQQRDLKEKCKETIEQQAISKQQFEEQCMHKDEIFKKTLANKDKMISDIQGQISRAQEQYEKAKSLRLNAESQLKSKEEINIKLQDRIEQQRKAINDLKKDMEKENLIDELKKQNELRRENLKNKQQQLAELDQEYQDQKEIKLDLDADLLELEHRLDKINNDLEDKRYLEGRLLQAQKGVDDLKEQQQKAEAKISKKKQKIGGSCQSIDELQGIIDMILKLSQFERDCAILDDQCREIENKLHILGEESELILSQHLNNKDKLLHSIGKQKGQSSTGGLGFLIKFAMIEKKMDDFKDELVKLKQLKDKSKKKLDESVQQIQQKNFEKVTKNELEHAIIINQDVKNELTSALNGLTEQEKAFYKVKDEFIKSSERLRQSYIVEVQERIQLSEDENSDIFNRVGVVIEALKKFESESEKQTKMMRNKEKKDEVKRLRDLGQTIKEDCNEVKANLNIRKNQIEKSKRNNKDLDKMSIGKICSQLQELKVLDNLSQNDNKDATDLERRVGDLSILFRDLIKSVIKDIFNELESKMKQRNKQLQQLIKKDQALLQNLEQRKNELFKVQQQLEDEDTELLTLYKKLDQSLHSANQDEESGSVYLRQLQSQTDRLQKQVSRISKENFNQEEINELLDQLDSMDQVISQCDNKLEDGLDKVTRLEGQLQEMELKIKIERIHECESEQKVTSETQEKLKRTLDRMQAQITVIEKDQNYLLDEFNDMEKKKESLAFKQELEKKIKEFAAFKVLRDKYKTQRDQQESVYEDKQRIRDQIPSNEFQKMRKESQKLREEIVKVIDTITGPYNEEITACKEVIDKMIKKYKNKKDKFQSCQEMKLARDSELIEWRDKLLSMRDRIQMIEGQLGILGVNEAQEGVEIYKKFLADLERMRQNAVSMEKAIQKFQERISDESEDLEQMEMKIVKTARLEDIEKALELIGMQIEGYEKEVEKFDLMQKQIEKEVEAFMNKIRSQQLFECEQKIKECEDVINQLIKKLVEVGGEVDSFKVDLQQAQLKEIQLASSVSNKNLNSTTINSSSGGAIGQKNQNNPKSSNNALNLENNQQSQVAALQIAQRQLANRDELVYKSEQFVERVDEGDNQRGKIQQTLQVLKQKVGALDKKNVSMNEIFQILSDAQTIGVTATSEIKKANDVQEELRQLNQQWKDKNKAEGERLIALARAKDLLRNNADMLEQMKQHLAHSKEKLGDFDCLYKAMLGSDDFNPKKAKIEKKMRRIAQLKAECGRLNDDKESVEKTEAKNASLDLDSIEDLDQLNKIIKESEKVAQILQTDVKELEEMSQGFDKKRQKVQDAEIRALVVKRKNELQSVQENLQSEMKKMLDFEALVQLKQKELLNTEGPNSEKSKELDKTLDTLKKQLNEFKKEYDKVEDEIRDIVADIQYRDLEKTEPLPKLARDIEKLKAQNIEIKELKCNLEKFQLDFSSKRQMLSGMDTEKKLKHFINEIEKEMINLEEGKKKLSKIVNIAKSYDGYTSGSEDEEFFQVITVEGQELNQEMLQASKTYTDLMNELNKINKSLEEQKKKQGGQLSQEIIDDVNDKLSKLEGKYSRTQKTSSDIIAVIEQNQEKVSHHDLENKVDRRGEELKELSKILNDVRADTENQIQKVQAEIQASKDNAFYDGYCKKLNDQIPLLQNVFKMIDKLVLDKEDLQEQQKKTRKKINLQVNERLELFYSNLELKKKIQGLLKSVGDTHTQVKKVFQQSNDCINNKPKEQPKAPAYKFDPNDEVDKLFAQFLNKLGINIPIKRLGGGYYMFGTKKIFCKIINGKLVVRVGGGFMGIEEFIMQYGQQEVEKLGRMNGIQEEVNMRLQEDKSNKSNMKMKGMESPKTDKSASDASVMGGGGAGQSTFLKKAANKIISGQQQSDFDSAVEEAKRNFKEEEAAIGGGHQTTTVKKPAQSTASVAGSATSKFSSKPPTKTTK